ncbi:MAG: SRPBCC family protein [Pirellulales bacterium]|nr:SRPBCC family protein [Pirellulales bacterium]
MPHGSVTEVLPASAEDVFRIIHDYRRRLEWDTLLQDAYLEPGHEAAALGAVAVCRGRRRLGGFALRTVYISFDPGRVAAIRMINRPPFFDRFAATIRHTPLSENSSQVDYKFDFAARPSWLRWLLHPIMQAAFRWETRRRLSALRRRLEQGAASWEA